MNSPYAPHLGKTTAIGHTLAPLLGLAMVGWLFMLGMIWELAAVMPLSELGPGMAWLGIGPFADLEPSGLARFFDALCTVGANPQATLTEPTHILGMWMAMAVAMMLPAAFPDLQAYLSARKTAQPLSALGWVSGFVGVWAVAAVAGTVLQLALFSAGLLGDGMVATTAPVAAALLLLAGAYQFTTWKTRHRTPCLPSRHGSAVSSGWSAGWQSVRCCWALMVAMFALGVMNILAAVVLTALMVSERTQRGGRACSLLGGMALMVYAAVTLLA